MRARCGRSTAPRSRRFGIPGPVLMENAGRAIFQEIERRFPELHEEKFVIVAGKGNNGGDGLVVARHLRESGGESSGPSSGFRRRGQGRRRPESTWPRAVKMGPRGQEPRRLAPGKSGARAVDASVVVDAVFGTGLLRPADGLYAAAIEDINARRPSRSPSISRPGCPPTAFELIGPGRQGRPDGDARPHPRSPTSSPPADGLCRRAGRGRHRPAPPPFGRSRAKARAGRGSGSCGRFAGAGRATPTRDLRPCPRLLGSLGKTGAALLAGQAALRMGAGLVTVATAESACRPWRGRHGRAHDRAPRRDPAEDDRGRRRSRGRALPKGKNAVLIGPGLSTHPSTAEFVCGLLPKLKGPAVIDADGLNILASGRRCWTRLRPAGRAHAASRGIRPAHRPDDRGGPAAPARAGAGLRRSNTTSSRPQGTSDPGRGARTAGSSSIRPGTRAWPPAVRATS